MTKRNRKPLIGADSEVREITSEDMKEFKPFSELPLSLRNKLTGRGRPKIANPKVLVSLRIDQDVIHKFKAKGKGWQTRINEALRKAV